jgi:Cdc6-like AAA superfamily ATPase
MPSLIIDKYDVLRKYVRAFRTKNIGLLIIVSRAGLGKTTLVEEELEIEAPLVLNSHITPLAFYKILAEKNRIEKDCLIVIDEAEMMFRDAKLKTMLKLLCDTRQEKVIQYNSTTPLLKGLPAEIHTDAKVIMLINTLEPKDEDIKAIMSRGHLISFQPSDAEIFNYLNKSIWADDKEVVKFIKGFANLSKSMSLRTYVKAVESKKSSLDWKASVINDMELDQRLLVVERILQDKTIKKEAERIKEWAILTNGSQADYYRFRKIYLVKVLGKAVI